VLANKLVLCLLAWPGCHKKVTHTHTRIELQHCILYEVVFFINHGFIITQQQKALQKVNVSVNALDNIQERDAVEVRLVLIVLIHLIFTAMCSCVYVLTSELVFDT